MKISYIREMKRSYLTIETEDEEQREKGAWEAGMLEQNRIRGLLPMRVRYEEGREIYCYDITSRQPLERILETHAMTGEQVRSLFWQLYRALEEMEKYLLESGGILLTPELIYAEPERFEIGLCAVPGGKGDFAAELSHFLQYLLKHVDHRDKDCVVLAYGLYQESLKENYGIEDLVKIVAEEKTGRPPQEAGQKAERIKGIQKTGEDEVRDTSGALQKAEGRSNKTACRGKLPRIYRRRLPDRLNYAKRKGSLKKYWKTAFKTYGSHSRHVQPDLSGNLVSERNRNTFKSQLLSGHRRSCGRGFYDFGSHFLGKKRKETGGYRETDKKYQG